MFRNRLLVALTLHCCLIAQIVAEEPTKPKTETKPVLEVKEHPPLESFLVVPVRLHLMQTKDFPAANCSLAEKDLHRILGKVNQVWAYAGITFGLESIQKITPETDKFQKLCELNHALQKATEATDKADNSPDEPKQSKWQEERNSRLFRSLIPQDSRNTEGFRVYYIEAFDVNGIYYGHGDAMVKATANLRKVPNGIDEPIPRVTAHELGHGLGLEHRQDKINLMASGTTGTLLNTTEVASAREIALKTTGTLRFVELPTQIESEKNSERKAMLETWRTTVQALAGNKQ
jgi:hypothetical protein